MYLLVMKSCLTSLQRERRRGKREPYSHYTRVREAHVVDSEEGLGSVRFASNTSLSSPLPMTSAIYVRHNIPWPFSPSRQHPLTSSSGDLRLSSSSDRILEYCTDSSRCLPEQWIHMRIPRLTLSQVGSGALQSQHLSLPGRLRILVTIR